MGKRLGRSKLDKGGLERHVHFDTSPRRSRGDAKEADGETGLAFRIKDSLEMFMGTLGIQLVLKVDGMDETVHRGGEGTGHSESGRQSTKEGRRKEKGQPGRRNTREPSGRSAVRGSRREEWGALQSPVETVQR